MTREESMKLDQIAKLLKNNMGDLSFVTQHLNSKNNELLAALLKEQRVKMKKPKATKEQPAIRSLLLTVFDDSRLAAELAVALSKLYSKRSIAIIDSDRFNPKLNVYLNTKSYVKSVFTHLDYHRSTGLNLLIDAVHKHTLTKQYVKHLALRVKGHNNIHYFSGSYILDDYEYFKLEDYKVILSFLRTIYDVVIVSTNNFIYDAYTCHSLMVSDYNLIASGDTLTAIHEKLKYMDFLERKQKIPSNKNCYVIFDYHVKTGLDRRVLDHLIKDQYMIIPYQKSRRDGLMSRYLMTRHMKKKQLQLYLKLIKLIDRGLL